MELRCHNFKQLVPNRFFFHPPNQFLLAALKDILSFDEILQTLLENNLLHMTCYEWKLSDYFQLIKQIFSLSEISWSNALVTVMKISLCLIRW